MASRGAARVAPPPLPQPPRAGTFRAGILGGLILALTASLPLRARDMADKRSFPGDRQRWLIARDAIYDETMSRGWNRQRQAFVQSYDSDTLDAANLIMPLVSFVSPRDPRFLSTLDAIMRELTSSSLVYRYNVEHSPDGLRGDEGTFSMYTFWLGSADARRPGRTGAARLRAHARLC